VLFSVIIPTFNRAALLRHALESVFQQEFRDFEVIVVDDGSTEDMGPLIEEFRGRAAFLRQQNAGPGPARNRGAQAARGDYLAFLDSDDLWFPWTLAAFARLIGQYNSPAILSAQLAPFHDEGGLSAVHDQPAQAEVFDDYFASNFRGYFVGAGMSVLRRDEFLKTGGFRAGHVNAEDHDLILRMGIAPGFVQVLQPATLAWRRHPGSATIDTHRTYEGVSYLVEQERRGAYPGGPTRARERREIICRHVRPVIMERRSAGIRPQAWKLYRATLRWHILQRRWTFLAGFPMLSILRHG
jgi:glycosyltransferase involved in cell wall biosynthesis